MKERRKFPSQEAGVKSSLRLLFVFGLISALLVVSASGQTTNGNIQGTVVDPSSAAVAGATVTARNMDTGLTAAATTTGAGVYALPNLPPGRYEITVAVSGMK